MGRAGALAAYLLQRNQVADYPGRGALVGFLAGLGAVVNSSFIPVMMVAAPIQREMVERLERANGVPPEFRDYMGG